MHCNEGGLRDLCLGTRGKSLKDDSPLEYPRHLKVECGLLDQSN